MFEIIRDIKDHVHHLASLVRTSKTAPLADKIQAKEVEEQAIVKLDNMLSVSPYGADKLVRDYLTVGDASKVCSNAMSGIGVAFTNLSSLIHNQDKTITDISYPNPFQNKKVVNSFTGTKGSLKAIISTETTSYGIVLSDDTNYHFAEMKFWIMEE